MYIFKVLLSATYFFQTFILRCVVYLFTGAVLLLWLMCLCLIFIMCPPSSKNNPSFENSYLS